jgi:hypothetical protein
MNWISAKRVDRFLGVCGNGKVPCGHTGWRNKETDMRKVRGAVVGGLAAVMATFALAAPAQAFDAQASCLFSGEAKVTDKADPTLGVRLVGGKGNFTFNSTTLICTGVSKGAPSIVITTFNASGWFENIVCGTGKAVGTITSVGDPKYNALLSGHKFLIVFDFWSGMIYWHFVKWHGVLLPDTKVAPPGSKGAFVKRWTLAGAAQAAPPTQKTSPVPNTPPGNCTKAFSLAGTVLVDI